jgi:hypothetical protein
MWDAIQYARSTALVFDDSLRFGVMAGCLGGHVPRGLVGDMAWCGRGGRISRRRFLTRSFGLGASHFVDR